MKTCDTSISFSAGFSVVVVVVSVVVVVVVTVVVVVVIVVVVIVLFVVVPFVVFTLGGVGSPPLILPRSALRELKERLGGNW